MMVLPKIGVVINTGFVAFNIFVTGFSSLALSLEITFTLNKLPLGKYISGKKNYEHKEKTLITILLSTMDVEYTDSKERIPKISCPIIGRNHH